MIAPRFDTILITGAAGNLGTQLRRGLAPLARKLRLNDVKEIADLKVNEEAAICDLADEAAVHAMCEGVDAIVHFGGAPVERPWEEVLNSSIRGSYHIYEGARKHGVKRIAYASSVHAIGFHPLEAHIDAKTPQRPDTLYGEVKLAAEEALGPGGTSLRITGVYGPPVPGRAHKWADLLESFEAGRHMAPRISTEVHAEDVAAAVALVIETRAAGVVNVSDIVLDRRDLLETWAKITGRGGVLPPTADPGAVREMDTARLRGLGWQPRGGAGVREVLGALAAQ